MKTGLSGILGMAGLFLLTLFKPLSKVSLIYAATVDKTGFGCLLAAYANHNITGV
jgi:hypothetical protein